jgi:MYXO-CTERM domain-containing protein
MTFGVATMAPVAAQETPDAPAVEEDDGGFDDWGLFGLLGLAGLLGLRKRDDHGTHVVERVGQPRH